MLGERSDSGSAISRASCLDEALDRVDAVV